MRWLNKDRQKSLLLYFYGYCVLAIGAYACSLSGITFFLVYGFPVICTLFIIIHQDILQRNFVALHAVTTMTTELPLHAWPEILVRSLLVLLHRQQEITCVIEQHDSLATFIKTSFLLRSSLQQGMLETLLEKKQTDSFVWMNNQGIINSLEGSWIPHEKIFNNAQQHAKEWLECALLFTSKTDALILRTTATQRTFTVISKGILHEGLTADHMVRILQGANSHVQSTQKYRAQHPTA